MLLTVVLLPLKTLIMVQVSEGKFSTGKLLQIIDMFDDVCKEKPSNKWERIETNAWSVGNLLESVNEATGEVKQ